MKQTQRVKLSYPSKDRRKEEISHTATRTYRFGQKIKIDNLIIKTLQFRYTNQSLILFLSFPIKPFGTFDTDAIKKNVSKQNTPVRIMTITLCNTRSCCSIMCKHRVGPRLLQV